MIDSTLRREMKHIVANDTELEFKWLPKFRQQRDVDGRMRKEKKLRQVERLNFANSVESPLQD